MRSGVSDISELGVIIKCAEGKLLTRHSAHILRSDTATQMWLFVNEWMNDAFYIALYCVLLYTQSALQSCGGGLSSNTTSVQLITVVGFYTE